MSVENLALVPHPNYPCAAISRISITMTRNNDQDLCIHFVVIGDVEQIIFPEKTVSMRTDELWKNTCFEMFVMQTSGYLEYNFSPSSQWAAYTFSARRSGMRNLEHNEAPVIEDHIGPQFYEMTVQLPLLPFLQNRELRIGLSAIIAEKNGAKSYWALRHPDGDADFHHPECFDFTLPAVENL